MSERDVIGLPNLLIVVLYSDVPALSLQLASLSGTFPQLVFAGFPPVLKLTQLATYKFYKNDMANARIKKMTFKSNPRRVTA